MKRSFSREFFAAAAALAFGAVAAQAMPCARSSAVPVHVILAMDESSSITVQQRAEWVPVARGLLSALCAGDRLQMFGIHSNTSNSGPLFDGALPPAPAAGAAIQDLIRFKQQVLAFQKDADRVIVESLGASRPAAKATDVVGVFDRVHRDQSRPVRLVVFSDALNADAELNLERMRLRGADVGAVVRKLAGRHGWGPDTLSHAVVRFVLPSLRDGDTAPGPNDRVVLRDFYATLIGSMGGTLADFETHLGGGL